MLYILRILDIQKGYKYWIIFSVPSFNIVTILLLNDNKLERIEVKNLDWFFSIICFLVLKFNFLLIH
jgi:hypothetical protein